MALTKETSSSTSSEEEGWQLAFKRSRQIQAERSALIGKRAAVDYDGELEPGTITDYKLQTEMFTVLFESDGKECRTLKFEDLVLDFEESSD